jgi:hypothetical protein
MSNRWGISSEVEEFVRQRDKSCVYCGVDFTNPYLTRKTKPSFCLNKGSGIT